MSAQWLLLGHTRDSISKGTEGDGIRKGDKGKNYNTDGEECKEERQRRGQ
jgi:hypothetical protein